MIHVTIQQLSSYLDEQLNDGSADLVRQHLAECADCEGKLGTLSRMDAAITRALSHEPGDDLFRRLEREIASKLGTDAKAEQILEVAPVKASARVRGSAPSAAPPSAPKQGGASPPDRGSTSGRPSVREVPATAWTPRADRGRAAPTPEPSRSEGSSA